MSRTQATWMLDSDVRDAFVAWAAWFVALSMSTAKALGLDVPKSKKDRSRAADKAQDALMSLCFATGLYVDDATIQNHYVEEYELQLRSVTTLDREHVTVTGCDTDDVTDAVDFDSTDAADVVRTGSGHEHVRAVLAEKLPESCLVTLAALRAAEWSPTADRPNAESLAQILGVSRPAAHQRIDTLLRKLAEVKASMDGAADSAVQ